MPEKASKAVGFDVPPAGKTYPQGRNYLLVIGIDRYRNNVPLLHNAVRDATALRDCLWASFQFDQEHTTCLFDEAATRQAILDAFDTLLETLTDQDNLVFYFSGHGDLHQPTSRGHWLPVDAIAGNRSTYLSNNEVLDFINALKARHVFGVVDSCFSGALFAKRSLQDGMSRQYSLPSRWLLTAGRLEVVSDGRLGDNSPFAKSLLAQLQHAESSNLWVGDLCRSVLKGVAYNAEEQLPQGEPLQGAGHQGGEFLFLRKGEKIKSLAAPTDRSAAGPPVSRGLSSYPTLPAAGRRDILRWLTYWGAYMLLGILLIIGLSSLLNNEQAIGIVERLIPWPFYFAPFFAAWFSRPSRRPLQLLTMGHAALFYGLLLLWAANTDYLSYPGFGVALLLGGAGYYFLLPLIAEYGGEGPSTSSE